MVSSILLEHTSVILGKSCRWEWKEGLRARKLLGLKRLFVTWQAGVGLGYLVLRQISIWLLGRGEWPTRSRYFLSIATVTVQTYFFAMNWMRD
ncbi:hypothetical protein APY30_16515 [Xanthomonas citri pv. malvacearum]|nr:hypothetical protein APY30_16515 [Xanthomonas citri pv. malvacearum]